MGFFKKSVTYICRRTGGQQGFTLAEIMIVVALIGIMAAIASTSIINALPDLRLKEAARNTVSNFQRAKSEAARLNGRVAITFNQQLTNGGPIFDYVLWLDTDGTNLVYDPAADRVLLTEQYSRYGSGVRLMTAAELGGPAVTFPLNVIGLPAVAFNSRGMPRDKDDGVVAGVVQLINQNGTRRTVEVSRAGRIRVLIL